MSDDNLPQYLDIATDLADRARAICLQYFDSSTAVTFKADNSPLTIADTSINRMVIDTVQTAFPAHRVIGEEESFGDEGAEYAWICDPIDGTIPFSRGYPTFVFSLALVRNGEPLLAVVDDPVAQRRYVATKGNGTTLNAKPVQVDADARFDRSVISVEGAAHADVARLRTDLTELDVTQCRLQSCIYTAALVAAGRMGAMVYGGVSPWDAATAALLVAEAGGIVSDLEGQTQRYDGEVKGLIVAATPVIHGRLVELLHR